MNLIDIKNIVLKNWKTLIKFSILVVAVVFLILLLIYPVSYSSTATVLPPEKNASLGGLSSLIGSNEISNMISPGGLMVNSQLFIEILKSRTAAEYVINKNNLITVYDADDMDEAIKMLQKNISMELTKEGLIKFTSEASTSLFPLFNKTSLKAKNLCAEISNSYIEALDKINRIKLSSKARNARLYIESELLKTRSTLDSVEFALMNFQKSNKTISLPDQVKNSIETAAKIKSEIIKTEVEIGLAEKNYRENNRSLIAIKQKLQQLNDQYNKIQVGSPDYLMTFREVPELGKEMASLMREAKIQNEVYLMLQQQYYKEKIQENKDLPTVEFLDKAIPPKKASGPRVILASVFSGVLAFLFPLSLMIFIELLRKKNK